MTSKGSEVALRNWLKRPIMRSRRTYGGVLVTVLGAGAVDYLYHHTLVSALRFAALMLVVSLVFAWFESQKDFWKPRESSEEQ